MDQETEHPLQDRKLQEPNQLAGHSENRIIQVIQEFPVIKKEIVETGKVLIRKTVTEEDRSINLPIFDESYTIERVAINQVIDTPPPAMRYEGDTIIIPVLREVTVVKKSYEIIEELRITKTVTETPFVQEITLLKENVHIERNSTNQND